MTIFASTDLQQAFDDVNEKLTTVEKYRNNISKDIKALEKYLGNVSINEHYFYDAHSGFFPHKPDQEVDDHELEPFEEEGIYVVEQIIWDCESKRIIYAKNESRSIISSDSLEFGVSAFLHGDSKEIECRPLIETSFKTRESMHRYLPSFLRSLARSLRGDILPPQEELPF